ncbi:MAG: 4Fe-4S binding protein [Actinobacteria bacterium]|nr:4Fe-4S binding protein [Actinomycetota bacterium]
MGEPSDKRPVISEDDCTGCGLCIDVCEQECLDLVDDVCKLVKPEACIGCADCEDECPVEAIQMQ